jgi:Uma2 family endonuclease
MHALLLADLGKIDFPSEVWILPSLTIQITATRYRVPDIVVFDVDVSEEEPAVTSEPLLVIEILSPQDTMMHVADLVADYLQMGVQNIWLVDPAKEIGWVCKKLEWSRTRRLEFESGQSIVPSLLMPTDD